MPDFDAKGDVQQGAVLASDSLQPVLDQAFNLEIDEAQPFIEKLIQKFDPVHFGPAAARVKAGLEALWNYFEAMRIVQAEANFSEAARYYALAQEGFASLGHKDLATLAVGMRAYCQAVLEIQQFNIGQALELFGKVKDYLKNAGQYGSRYRALIDHMEPDALATAGVNALFRMDYASSKSLLERASQASSDLAEKYYDKTDPLYSSFLGMAHYYRAFMAFFLTLTEASQFNYDKIASEKDLASEARLAAELLKKGSQAQGFKAGISNAEGFVELIEALSSFSKIMQHVLRSTFKADMNELGLIRVKIQKAIEFISQGGPQNVPFVRLCEQLLRQIDNLERLARPRKKDFGIYSGVITLALFVPLFLVVAWANQFFDTGIKGASALSACLGLALVAGFGFGALKFKSLFFFKSSSKGS